ncbi:hypothetical protein D3C81_2077920 [compost metagenome]
MVFGEPAGRAGLVELELVLDKVAQTRQQVMLQRVLGRLQGLRGIRTDVLCGGHPVRLQHQFPEGPSVLVVVGEQKQQLTPQFGVIAEPVEQRGR